MEFVDPALKEFFYRIVCSQCFVMGNQPGKYKYNPHTHICDENILAVKFGNKDAGPWMRVRERLNHRDFNGNYVLCNSVREGATIPCKVGEMNCSFAHNHAEQYIWGMEKAGRLSIADFILQNRMAANTRSFSIAEVLKKYGGFFTFVCRVCFYGRPPRIVGAGPNGLCAGK